jgi:deazaflavin-dependent oxidoreductase (nitroreductase family)
MIREAVLLNAIGSLASVALACSLRQRGVEIDLILPNLVDQMYRAVLWLGTVDSSLRTAARDVKALQARASRGTLKVVASMHQAAYQASAGHLGGTFRGGPVLLLTTIGRRSGQERRWPLCYVSDGPRYALVASAGGARRHPGWYLNLQTNPRVTVQTSDGEQTMRARTATGDERARLWARLLRRYPVCGDYQRRTPRRRPVVVLEPVAAGLDPEASAASGCELPGPRATGLAHAAARL